MAQVRLYGNFMVIVEPCQTPVEPPKFHVNIMTGSGVMKLFFHKGLEQKSRNLRFAQYLETRES